MDLQKTDATSGGRPANRESRQNINTTQTPFTNIKTCNSTLGAQTTGDSARNYNTRCSTLPRGVISAILQLSPAETFRRWIRSKILRDGFKPGMFSKVVSTLLEILRETAGAGASPGSTSRVSTLLEILQIAQCALGRRPERNGFNPS